MTIVVTKKPLPLWVWLFIVQQLIGILAGLRGVASQWRYLLSPNHRNPVLHAVAAPYETAMSLLFAAIVAASVVGVVLTFRRASITRIYWLTLLVVLPTWRLLQMGTSELERRAIAHAGFIVRPAPAIPIWSYVFGCAMIAAWWLYWARSRAVRETFVKRRTNAPDNTAGETREPLRTSPAR
jgi:hypothetical protein